MRAILARIAALVGGCVSSLGVAQGTEQKPSLQTAFGRYCVAGAPSPEEQVTTDALRKAAAAAIPDIDHPDCETLERALLRSEGLTLSGQQLTSIVQLKEFTQLKRLDIEGNSIKDLTPLSGYDNLVSIWGGGNQIQSMAPLSAAFPTLRVVSLPVNQITKIEGIGQDNSLTDLILDQNQLTNLEGLEYASSMIDLSVVANHITTLRTEGGWTAVTLFADFNQIQEVGGFPERMIRVRLAGNPLSTKTRTFLSQWKGNAQTEGDGSQEEETYILGTSKLKVTSEAKADLGK